MENDLTRNIITVASFYLQNNDFQTTLRFQYYKDDTLGQFKIEDQVRGETKNFWDLGLKGSTYHKGLISYFFDARSAPRNKQSFFI